MASSHVYGFAHNVIKGVRIQSMLLEQIEYALFTAPKDLHLVVNDKDNK